MTNGIKIAALATVLLVLVSVVALRTAATETPKPAAVIETTAAARTTRAPEPIVVVDPPAEPETTAPARQYGCPLHS